MNPKKDIFSTSKGKWDFTIAIIVIALFSVFVYQFLFNTEEEIVVQTPIESTDVSAAEENQYIYTNSNTYQAKTIQAEDAYDSDVSTAVVISDIKENNPFDSISKPINELSKTIPSPLKNKKVSDSIVTPKLEKELETSAQKDEEIIEVPSTQLEEQEQEEIIEEPSAQIDEETIAETETVEPALIDETETITTNSTTMNCVVVVGVFKKVANKTAIIEKLKSLGHKHTDGILRDGLNYVGVPVSCDSEQEMQKLLGELNKDFGIDSWVMKL